MFALLEALNTFTVSFLVDGWVRQTGEQNLQKGVPDFGGELVTMVILLDTAITLMPNAKNSTILDCVGKL